MSRRSYGRRSVITQVISFLFWLRLRRQWNVGRDNYSECQLHGNEFSNHGYLAGEMS